LRGTSLGVHTPSIRKVAGHRLIHPMPPCHTLDVPAIALVAYVLEVPNDPDLEAGIGYGRKEANFARFLYHRDQSRVLIHIQQQPHLIEVSVP
jgi:hypothetical protein